MNIKTETNLTISIALCTYNGERYLRTQLDCFANQTRLPDEVVVHDDGSTDETLEILEQWAKEVPFTVKIVRNLINLGYAKNFQETFLDCSGDIIFPSDQDDYWFPDKLEQLASVLENDSECVWVAGRVIHADENLTTLSEVGKNADLKTNVFDACAFHVTPNSVGCGMAFRKTLLKEAFPLPDGWSHDMWLCVVGRFFGKGIFVEKPVIKHRTHTKSVTVATSENLWRLEKNVYYAFSLYQFQYHARLRRSFQERMKTLPDGAFKTQCLRCYAHQETHFGNRLKVQNHVLTAFPLLFLELIMGRYFRHDQPLKCILFDIKEGILNLLHINKTQEESEK